MKTFKETQDYLSKYYMEKIMEDKVGKRLNTFDEMKIEGWLDCVALSAAKETIKAITPKERYIPEANRIWLRGYNEAIKRMELNIKEFLK